MHNASAIYDVCAATAMNVLATADKTAASPISPGVIVLIVVIVVLIALLVVLTIWGRKLEKQQNEAKRQMDAMAQTCSALIIDKKKKKITESGLPQNVIDQVPWYAKMRKVPVIKAKIGPKIVTLLSDDTIFEIIPVKSECKVVVSGLYITELKSVRGGVLPKPTEKKGFFAKMRDKLAGAQSKAEEEKAKSSKKEQSVSYPKSNKKKKK